MKRETKIRAIERLLASRRAEAAATEAASAAEAAVCGGDRQSAEAAAAAAWEARQAAGAAAAAWRSLSREQRDYALAADVAGERIGRRAMSLGGDYSGATEREVTWGDAPAASTTTGAGRQYSRRCTYRRLDARHAVVICPAGVVDLIDSPELERLSAADGLPLISYTHTGAAVWVVSQHKRIVAQRGWVATAGGDGSMVVYHSTISLDHAVHGARRKAALAAREAERVARDRATESRADRRARLVLRLCAGARATVGDALRAGYCRPGIAAWQARHGIGDEAPLAALAATGDPLATRLALDLARRLRRERRPAETATA